MSALFDNLNRSSKVSIMNFEKMTTEDAYEDTGYLQLNAIMSASLSEGIPKNKFIFFVGESQSGKSLLTKHIVRNLIKNEGYTCVWYDVEMAIEDNEEIYSMGIDPKSFIVPEIDEAWTLERWSNNITDMLERIDAITKKDPTQKHIIVLDSLNALPTNKEIADSDRLDSVNDMGSKAKIIQARFKAIFQKFAKIPNMIFIGINHVYANPDNHMRYYLKYHLETLLNILLKELFM